MRLDGRNRLGISFDPFGKTYGRYGEDKFSVIKRHGYDWVDLNLCDTDTAFYLSDEENLKHLIQTEKNEARRAGIQISQIHGPWRYPPKDGTEADREERMEKMKRAVVISSLLECKHLVIHPLMPFGTRDAESGKNRETRALNLAFFRELVAFAKQYGVTICLENMPMREFSLSVPAQILELVKEIDDEHLKICLDTGHVAVFPGLSVGNEVRRLGKYIKVLHMHDNLGDRDSHLYPAKGIVDWPDLFAALDEIGFQGALSLETAPSGDLENDVFEQEGICLNSAFRDLASGKQRTRR